LVLAVRVVLLVLPELMEYKAAAQYLAQLPLLAAVAAALGLTLLMVHPEVLAVQAVVLAHH
jgi:uncharacterized protein (DUF2267 family)